MHLEPDLGIQPWSWKITVTFTGIGFIFLLFQTTIQAWLAYGQFGPDLCLLIILYYGLNTPFITGAVLCAVVGFLKDTAGGGVLGLYPGIYLVVFWFVGRIRQSFNPSAPFFVMLYILAFTVWAGLLYWMSLYFLGRPIRFIPDRIGGPTGIFLISSLFTALCGLPVFRVLDFIRTRFRIRSE